MLEISNDVNIVKTIKNYKIRHIIHLIMGLGLPALTVMGMIGIFIANLCFSAGISTLCIPIMNLYVQGSLIISRNRSNKLETEMKKFCKELSAQTSSNCSIYDLESVEIIPKNLKLGEDLTKKNIVEIFRDGHYVLIHSIPDEVVIRQYFDDNEELHVELLQDEAREEALTDIYTSGNSKVKKLALGDGHIK